jgi:hypothetical protein
LDQLAKTYQEAQGRDCCTIEQLLAGDVMVFAPARLPKTALSRIFWQPPLQLTVAAG